MLDDQTKREILVRILESPQFKDSKRSQELLQYLVDATLANKSPKEITIAMDFFGKDASFDPKEDPTVRVQINHLRKKLDHYYLTTINHEATPFPIRHCYLRDRHCQFQHSFSLPI